MKGRILIGYALLLFVVGLFWHSSYKADAGLRSTFAKPDPTVDHQSLDSAKEEIDYLRSVQSDLIVLHHQAHVRHTQAALFTLLASTLMLSAVFRGSKAPQKEKLST